MKVKTLLFCLCFIAYKSHGQTTSIYFHPVFGETTLSLENKEYKLGQSDSIQFETLKFYISNLKFVYNNQIVFKEENSFHLVDASIDSSMKLDINIPKNVTYNEIQFDLGIDSITNVSGSLGGDLDPTKGMYWTWQSGYINFKLEGKSNLCKTRLNEFQFHLGGYVSPFSCLQTIHLKTNKNEPIQIYLDVKRIFDSINLTTQNHIMSPNQEAVDFSKVVANCFYIH